MARITGTYLLNKSWNSSTLFPPSPSRPPPHNAHKHFPLGIHRQLNHVMQKKPCELEAARGTPSSAPKWGDTFLYFSEALLNQMPGSTLFSERDANYPFEIQITETSSTPWHVTGNQFLTGTHCRWPSQEFKPYGVLWVTEHTPSLVWISTTTVRKCFLFFSREE